MIDSANDRLKATKANGAFGNHLRRFVYWSFILASTMVGAMLLAAVPWLTQVLPRYAFVISGAMGGLVGCSLGSRIAAMFVEQPTEFMSNREYVSLFWRHLAFAVVILACAGLVGGTIGVSVHSFYSSTSKSYP
jgi:hypothetical protein